VQGALVVSRRQEGHVGTARHGYHLSIGLKLNLVFRLSFGLKPQFKTLVLAET